MSDVHLKTLFAVGAGIMIATFLKGTIIGFANPFLTPLKLPLV